LGVDSGPVRGRAFGGAAVAIRRTNCSGARRTRTDGDMRVEPEDQPAVERLARYIMRPPISLEWMTLPALHIGKGTIRRRSRRGLAGWVPGSNFVRREQSCVPGIPSHRVAATQIGWYSNVTRGRRRREEESRCGCGRGSGHSSGRKRDDGPNARAFRRSWAQLIKRIYEVDPLVCQSCG